MTPKMSRQRRKGTLRCTPPYLISKLIEDRVKIAKSCVVASNIRRRQPRFHGSLVACIYIREEFWYAFKQAITGFKG
jgi:hypothetical protein